MKVKVLTEKEMVEGVIPAAATPRRVPLFGEDPPRGREKEGMMRIVFAANWEGCLDGIHPVAFRAGEEAEIPVAIASVLLQDGRAHLPGGVKMEAGAPENKMLPGPKSNKARSGGRKKA